MAKGYGIILMLIGHLHVNELMVWIYSFHMPLFFFVSGYLFNIKSNFLDFGAGKVKRMVIPYLFLYIPMLLADLSIEGTLSAGKVMEHLWLNLLQQRHSALWFLGCLIVLHFLYYPIVRYSPNRIVGAIISLMLGLTGVMLWRNGVTGLYWNFDIAMVAAPFFYGGYLMRGRINEARIKKMKTVTWAAAALTYRNSIYRTAGSTLERSLHPIHWQTFAPVLCLALPHRHVALAQAVQQDGNRPPEQRLDGSVAECRIIDHHTCNLDHTERTGHQNAIEVYHRPISHQQTERYKKINRITT